MPRSELTFRKRTLRAAVEALEAAGKHVTSASIRPDGTIVVACDSTVPVDRDMQKIYNPGVGAEPDEDREKWERRLKELDC